MAVMAATPSRPLGMPGGTRPGRARLPRAVEFAILFVAVPLAIALLLPPNHMFFALLAFSLIGLVLLWQSGGFVWRDLFRGWSRFNLPIAVAFCALTAICAVAIMWITRPEALMVLWHRDPRLLVMIWLLYPLVSALPQELIFRALFFHRYGTLFASPQRAVFVNAAIFSLAHLMYWNWIVAVLTFLGGLAFATGYLRRGFVWAWFLHAMAGNILFTAGMGVYFYSGNVVRPF